MIRRNFAKALAAIIAAPKVLSANEVEEQVKYIEPKIESVKHYPYSKPKNMELPRVVSTYDRWTLIESAEPLHKGDIVAVNAEGKLVRVGVNSPHAYGIVIEGGLSSAIVTNL